MRRTTWVLLGVALLLAAGGAVFVVHTELRESAAIEPVDPVKHARDRRMSAALHVAPAPLPSDLPLVARPGVNRNGYPRSYVDTAGVRSLLDHEKYDDLTRYLEQFQKHFDEDFRKEEWLDSAFRAFDTETLDIAPKLDAWVTAHPRSFAPFLARAVHRTGLAYAARGGSWAEDTAKEDFSAMKDFGDRALADLAESLVRKPESFYAHVVALRALLLVGDRASRTARVALADAACPLCVTQRVVYLNGLRPRWGGSYAEMTSLTASLLVSKNRALAALSGLVENDEADLAERADDYDRALRLVDMAIAKGSLSSFHLRRARILRHLGRPDAAMVDAETALDLSGDSPDALIERARLLFEKGEIERAHADLLAGMRIEPANARGRRLAPELYDALVARADEARKVGDRREALRRYHLAESLYVTREVQATKRELLLSGRTGSEAEIHALRAGCRENPDDEFVHLELDYVLAEKGRFAEIVELWNEFLVRHPNHPRAVFELSGAYHHLREAEKALGHLRSACRLGVGEACGIWHTAFAGR